VLPVEFVLAARQGAQRIESYHPTVWDRLRGFVTFNPGSVWAGGSALVAIAIIFTMTPASPVKSQHLELSTVRGAETSAPHANANTPIDLQLNLTELPTATSYIVELVDASGKVLRDYSSQAQDSKLRVSIMERLPAGQYWIRLYGSPAKNDLLREYALKIG